MRKIYLSNSASLLFGRIEISFKGSIKKNVHRIARSIQATYPTLFYERNCLLLNTRLIISILAFLICFKPKIGNAQNITYTITITQVSWTGNFDPGGGGQGNTEEYGLEGPSSCISASGQDNSNSTTASVLISSGDNVPAFTFTETYTGIENDGINFFGFFIDDLNYCENDGNNDEDICDVPISVDLATAPYGTSTQTFNCSGNEGTTSVTVTIDKSTILPITLTTFQATPDHDGIHLSWRTATEQNNDYMAVERSADGVKFEELGRVKGAGDTQEPQEYTFVDDNPLRGINYYRLRQVDFDGAFEYHKTISVLFDGKESGLGVRAFPNPAQGSLQASWAANADQPTTLQVLDMTGRQLAEYQLPAGVSTYELPLNAMPAGLYILQARQGGRTETMRFRKQ